MSLILPVPSRIVSLSEAAGFGPEPTPKVTVTREVWKSVLRKAGRTRDLLRLEKAEAKRKRKAKR